MKCWVCKRQARGYGHSDLRHPVGDARRYPIDWVFCSRRCQQAFHALYGQWLRVQEGRTPKTEVAMIDPSDVELAAMRTCLKAFGAAAGEIAEVDEELDRLSAREREVMRLIARGYTYKECGSELYISVKTVETHASAVLRKTQMSNRHALSRWAAERRLV